ncbi:thioredoxin domain-containing protein [Dactylosporangium sp. NPDC005572]|uniref:DsbA family protein n=1 Tax=Dactylosporangium sp. NPDC005572 TaxID=3156889 RepID=UPI0033AB5D2A
MSNTLSRPPNGDDHVQGVGGAPIVLVEYGDYADEATGRVFEVVERLQLQLGDRLRFAYRHFPLVDAHPRAMPAALLAEAAADAGAFWSMHALLLAHQDRLEDDDLQRYAQQFGLPDTGGNRVHYQRIDRDLASGRASGVDGTPAFFLNGLRQDADTLAATLGKVRNG